MSTAEHVTDQVINNVVELPMKNDQTLKLEVNKVYVDIRGEAVKITKPVTADDPRQRLLHDLGYRFLSDAGMAYKPDGTAITKFCNLYKVSDDKDVPPPAASAASYVRIMMEHIAEAQRIAEKIDIALTISVG